VITRAQLLAVGYNPAAIRHRVAAGRLHPLWEGVYAVGRPAVGRRGVLLAAVFTCSPSAMLSHQSAAELWGMRPRITGPIDVTVVTKTDPRRRGIRVHRRPKVSDVAQRAGIPLTSPAGTLVDVATR
jgi:predicted transcriptional regulator of viral defense system